MISTIYQRITLFWSV